MFSIVHFEGGKGKYTSFHGIRTTLLKIEKITVIQFRRLGNMDIEVKITMCHRPIKFISAVFTIFFNFNLGMWLA